MTALLTLASLPLFPLHTVLFPGGTLSLRVFEPRYRTLVRACREQGAPFGVVTLLGGTEVQQVHTPHSRFHTLGTLAHIESVTPLSAELELLHCTGQSRFRIQASHQLTDGLWTGDVELLPQDMHSPIPKDLEHSAAALRKVLQRLPPRNPLPSDQLFADCGWVANRWCELFPMHEHMQLQLLEMDSPLLRLELITDALEHAGIVPRQTMPS